MYCSKTFALVGLALAAPVATDAFAVISSSAPSPRLRLALDATREPHNEQATRRDAIRNIAAASTLTLGFLFPSANALAAEIRTMDFSLPSGSYDSISAPVSSGKDELTKTSIVNTTPSRKKKEDSGASAKESAAAARAERVAERKAKEAEQAVKDEQAAKERDEAIKAARVEKAAQRAAAQAEKAAAAAEKEEEAKYKGAKFVDASMPEY